MFRSRRGLQTRVRMFGFRATNIAAYRAQLEAPSIPALAHAFRRASQKATSTPFMCLGQEV